MKRSLQYFTIDIVCITIWLSPLECWNDSKHSDTTLKKHCFCDKKFRMWIWGTPENPTV